MKFDYFCIENNINPKIYLPIARLLRNNNQVNLKEWQKNRA